MLDSLCNGEEIPTAAAPSLIQLRSEGAAIDSALPGDADRCDLHPAKADKAIIVDGKTGLTCTASDLKKPSASCLNEEKVEKNPIQLGVRDTVRLYLVNKNPFLQTYKFSAMDTQIKDDDIGPFLSMLVPGISGSSQKPSSGQASSGKSDSANNNLDTLFGSEALFGFIFNSGKPMPEKLQTIDEALAVQNKLLSALEDKRRTLHPAATERQNVQNLFDEAAAKLEKANAEEARIQGSKEKNPDLKYLEGLVTDRAHSLSMASDLMEKATGAANKVNACVAGIESRVDTLTKNYEFFAQEYNRERLLLLSNKSECKTLSSAASRLWRLISYEQAKILDTRIDMNIRDAMVATTFSMPASDPSTKNKPVSGDSTLLAADLNSLASSLCTLKAMRTEIAPNLTSSLGGIESVLVNPNAFRSEILIGPYSDSTQVDWTLERTMAQAPIKVMDSASFDAAIDTCLSSPNPSTPGVKQQKPASSIGVAQSLVLKKPVLMNASFVVPATPDGGTKPAPKQKQSGSAADQSSSSDAGQQGTPSGSKDSSTTTRGRRINFGSERFIVSAGLTGAILPLKEFGKGVGQAFDASGNPVAGQSTANIIILKTDQSYRLSPMAFLNTRVHQWGGKAEVLYASFGITAKSDSNGVAPEYFVGLSQSVLQRHLLLSAGAYAGRQQQLTGGLFVNEAIPLNLTGDIPVRSNYQFRVGFSASWRIPGLAK